MRGSSGPSVEGPLVPATAPSRGGRECVTVSIIEEPAPAAMEVDTQPMDCCSPPTNLTSPQQQLQQFQQQMHGTPAQSLFVRGPFGRSRSNSAASSVTSVASNISDYSNLDDFEVPDQATPIRAVPRPKSLAVLQSLVARCQAKPHEDFLLNVQKNEVRPHKRADLLRWLFALNNHFQFGPNVFALTAEYVDRFLSVSKIKDKYLHIIGVASFLIASKMEEETDVQPTEAELVANGGDVFTINDLVRMETIVLSKLNWELRPVTPLAILDELISVCTEKLVAARGEDILQALPALRLGASIKLHMSLFHYQLRLLPAPWLALCVLAVELCELLSSTTVEGVLDEFSDLVGLDHATFLETVDLININLRFQAGLTLPQGTREDGGASPPSEQQMQMQMQMQQQQSQSQTQSQAQQRQSPPQQLQSRVLVTVSPA